MELRAADIARAAGMTRQTVTGALKAQKLIRKENGLYETTDPVNADWLRRRGVDPNTLESTSGPEAENIRQSRIKNPSGHNRYTKNGAPPQDSQGPSLPGPGSPESWGLPEYILNLSFRDAIIQYAGPLQLKGLADTLDKLLSAQKKEVEILQRRNLLVDRHYVEYLKSFVDTMMHQLFDFADSCSIEIIGFVMSDKETAKQKISEHFRKNIERLGKETQKRIDKELKKLPVRNIDAVLSE